MIVTSDPDVPRRRPAITGEDEFFRARVRRG